MTGKSKIPQNWPNFLKNDENKKELYPYFAENLKNMAPPGLVFASKDSTVVTNMEEYSELASALSSDHEIVCSHTTGGETESSQNSSNSI
eukprot:GHVR01067110.1.p2 GENE.GHVR01067110.1~~GHVR01067110.1.p2  ORF type:complete len:102 (-),score=10.47 GHVR01067110.1:788-1057(-)